MSLRKKSVSASLKAWTVAELGAFYTKNRRELISHAYRLLKDNARAEEVIQDALIKVMLAAPELESEEHAIGYMHRTIENLCMDIFRMEGRRPNLVVLDDAVSELESKWVDNNDHADVIAAAQDAAIVRQALAMLSPAERAALVMWEMEGRSTKEIAIELGIKESAVRHTVSRARASLRRVMSELIVDKERGLTALDILSTTYKKAVTAGKKSSKAALSLILVFFAFLGFNSIPTQNEELPINVAETTISQSQASSVPESTPAAKSSPSASSSASMGSQGVEKASLVAANAKATKLNFPGLDINGVPTGFTVTDATGALGSLYSSNREPIFSESELSLSQLVKTQEGAANILISQQLTSGASGFTYQANLSYGRKGSWIPLNSRVSFMDMERLLSGNYLLTVVLKVESEVETSIQISASTKGRDLNQAPSQVISRLVLNPSKTEVLAQAVNVVEKRAK